MTIPNLSFPQLSALLAAGAVVATTWRQVTSLLRWFSTLVFSQCVLTDDAAAALQSYIWERGRRSPFRQRIFGGVRTYVHPTRRVELVGYETFSSAPVLTWFRCRPLIVRRPLHSSDRNFGDVRGGVSNMLSVFFLRGTFNEEALVLAALEEFNRNLAPPAKGSRLRLSRFRVSRPSGNSASDVNQAAHATKEQTPPESVGSELDDRLRTKSLRLLKYTPEDLVKRPDSPAVFDCFPYPKEIMAALEEVRIWLENEQWFRTKGVPWRRGWLLVGPPGGGKSNLVKCIGVHFDLPIYAPDLASMSNREFIAFWQRAQSEAPVIVLLEDFDAVFHERTNITAAGKQRETLTFDCLLNTLSGVGNTDGVFTIITTNQPETLDPALGIADAQGRSTRPGRMDRVIELGAMAQPERQRLAEFILSDYPDCVAATVAAGKGETPAQFQDRCAQLALRLFWNKHAPVDQFTNTLVTTNP